MGGHRITFVETAADRREALRAGRSPISEPGLTEMLTANVERIHVVGSLEAVSHPPDIVFVAVATPVGEDGDPDVSQLVSAADALRVWPEAHVSIRSTLPPGTSLRLPEMLGRADGSRLSTNPEFLRQGTAMDDYARPSRIVIGRFPETEDEHLDRLDQLFAGIDAPRIHVSVQTAD